METATANTTSRVEVHGALEGVRVLEVAGPFGAYTGRMFAGLGADVILIEPPSGSLMRRRPPFAGDVPGPEGSLAFAYFHAGKRGVTLDLDTASGRAIFRRLAATAQVIVESEPAGAMGARGLGWDALAAGCPGLVYTSITPFGRDGPYVDYAATDLVLLALGGLLYLGGYPEVGPMAVHGGQAVLAADQFAAVGAMLALLDAEASGRGRHVDVSAQECVAMALENAAQTYDLEGRINRRLPAQRFAGAGVYPCKDGYVYLLVMTRGVGTLKFWHSFVRWLIEEGVSDAEQLLEPKWGTLEWNSTDEAKRIFADVFLPLAAQRTKAELYRAAQEIRFPLCPVSTTEDLVRSPQLQHRRFFTTVQPSATGPALVMPGAPYHLSEDPWRIDMPAPTLGQHNLEVYGELGLEAADIIHLKAAGVL